MNDNCGGMTGAEYYFSSADIEADRRGALVAFTLDIAHPHDVAEILGSRGVCIRAGHHCAQPLMQRFGTPATARASFYVYNTREEVDVLVEALAKAEDFFKI